MFTFQGLHARHFIQAFDAFILLKQCWRLAIQRIDVTDFILQFGVMLGSEPIAVEVGLNLGIFLKAAPRGAARST